MDQVIAYLQGIPSSEFYKTVGILIYSTCSGFVPNNNDLTVAATAFISQIKLLSPISTGIFCATIWSLGESTTFTLGHFLGPKLLKKEFIRKKLSEKKQLELKKMIDENLMTLILTIRVCPVMRAHTIVTLGALGLSPIKFFTRHVPVLFIHVMMIFNAFFYLGPVLKTFFADNSGTVMVFIFLLWISLMFVVGRKFYKKLEMA